jgi:hypothetical protein
MINNRLVKHLVIAVLLFTSTISASANSRDNKALSLQKIMAMAKIAGACGILDQQIAFQKTTRLDGGENFITRFWLAESARLALPFDDFVKVCQNAISDYDRIFKTIE